MTELSVAPAVAPAFTANPKRGKQGFYWWAWHPCYPWWSHSCWGASTLEEAQGLWYNKLFSRDYSHWKLVEKRGETFTEREDRPAPAEHVATWQAALDFKNEPATPVLPSTVEAVPAGFGRFSNDLENRLPDAFTNAIGLLEHLNREEVAQRLQSVAAKWFTELKELRMAAATHTGREEGGVGTEVPNYKGLSFFYIPENGGVKSYQYVAACRASNYHILKEADSERPIRLRYDELDKACSTKEAAWAIAAQGLEKDAEYIKQSILPQFRKAPATSPTTSKEGPAPAAS